MRLNSDLDTDIADLACSLAQLVWIFLQTPPRPRVRREYLDQKKYNIMFAFSLSFQTVGAEFSLRKNVKYIILSEQI